MRIRAAEDPLFEPITFGRRGPERRDPLSPAHIEQIVRTVWTAGQHGSPGEPLSNLLAFGWVLFILTSSSINSDYPYSEFRNSRLSNP